MAITKSRGALTGILRAKGWSGGQRHTNNRPSSFPAKVEIRTNVLEAVGPATASVFDAFAGDGEMHRAVWHRAANYCGCDTTWYRDTRLMFVADNRRVMRSIDLQAFNVFDFDAWGSPWEQVIVLCARRSLAPGERFGLVMTEGVGLKVKMGGLPLAFANLAGVNPRLRGGSSRKVYASLVDRAINEMMRRLHGRLARRWEALGKTATNMRYMGLVVEGLPAEIADAATESNLQSAADAEADSALLRVAG